VIRHAPSRRDSRSHATIRVIMRKTNRRHMTGDHHGQAVRWQLFWPEPRTGFSARTPGGGEAFLVDRLTYQGFLRSRRRRVAW
jgi:hypothetical protein